MNTNTDNSLDEAIHIRYATLADSCCSLSCGSALDQADVQRGEVVVDLGSGRGNDVFKAARKSGPYGFSYGVDYTQEMIDIAEANRKKLRLDNVRFLNASIDKIPLEDKSANVLISNCTINHAPDKKAVYSEIYRILKKGGRFIVSDVISETDLPQNVKDDPQAWAGCYGGAIPRDEYLKSVHDGGFDSVEILDLSSPYEKGGVMVRSITIKGIKN